MLIILLLAWLGLCFGSFVNALVWRLHEQGKRQKSKVKRDRGLSILNGRSMCPHCGHTLAWYDLMPVVSWLMLGGKCRYCKKPISLQYPAVELLNAGLFAGSYLFWPYGFTVVGLTQFVFWLILLTGFVALAVYDLKWMLLPNKVVYFLIAVAVVQVLAVSIIKKDGVFLLQAILASTLLFGFFYGLFQVSNGKWIGGGDVKLAIVLGLLAGSPLLALLLLFIASFLGSVVSIPLLLAGKANSHKVPFGPFLLLATVIVYIWGDPLISWYQQLFLLT